MASNIAIPVSFEESPVEVARAIEVAQKLASQNARITFIHIVEEIPKYLADHMPPEASLAREFEVRRRIDGFAERVGDAEVLLIDGMSGKTITDWASDKGADLIVMASHRAQMPDDILGSTAAWVVRHADCPVHVIR